MAEQQTQEIAEDDSFVYPVTVEDSGPATKKVTIEIPADRIADRLKKQFADIRQHAAVPGFRPGHAPIKLVERRFANEVRDQVRRELISESYQQAMEKNSLQAISEPEFDNAEDIKLPDDGPLSFSFQVEVQPEFLLPPVAGLRVRKPIVKITDENVERAVKNLCEQQGTLIPVEDRGVQADDVVVANVKLTCGDATVTEQRDAEVSVRPLTVAGIEIADFPDKLAGARSGEKRSIPVTLPETFAEEQYRGKPGSLDIEVSEVKRMQPAEMNAEFISDLGFSTESDLRDALRDQMTDRVTYDVQQAMRQQVCNYLLEKIHIDVPAGLSKRQTERIVARRVVDLMMRGVPQQMVEAQTQQLRTEAGDAAARELKLFFILQRIAQQQEVDVTEDELNGRVAILAAQRGKRPEKLKQDMAKDGTLAHLYVQMREQKALDKILAMSVIEEFDPAGGDATPQVQEPIEKPAEGDKPAEGAAPADSSST